jgi:antibiotic biosynthesis monooxygenase (ABM) superfamily enzyme
MRVRPGRDDDYRHWQEAVNDAAAGFAGFEGAELYPGERGEQVVVFRFADLDQLTAWLNSTIRRELISDGSPLFEGPPSEEVLTGGSDTHRAPDAVTAVISHRVRPGHERDFVQWQEKTFKAQEKSPGFMGSEMFRPIPGVQDNWVVAFRFDTRAHLDEWLDSDLRRRLLKEGESCIQSFDVKKVGSAFSGWFGFDEGSGNGVPPDWKQAMSVMLALYPIVMVLNLTVGAWLTNAKVPGYLVLFVGNLLSCGILTWLAMPLVNRALGFWLTPGGASSVRTSIAGAALVVACWGIFVLIFALTIGR